LSEIRDTTALGAASLAAVGAGVWTQDRVVSGWREAARFEPRMEAAERDELVAQWRRAVERARGWAVSG